MIVKYILFGMLFSISINLYANKNFFCLSNDGKTILLVPSTYPNIDEIKYYPYLKSIKLSNIVKTEYGDDGGINPEIYYTMNEIIKGKITGNYTFMSQGYLVYSVTYTNLKNKREINFEREYNLQLKGINCL